MGTEPRFLATCCSLVADVARASGEVRLRVAGSSMVPVLWPGDLVLARSCDLSQLEPGQIVVFRQDGRLIIHRILATGDGIITRGDARPCLDARLGREDLIGRVESALRDGKAVRLRPTPWQALVAFALRRSEILTSAYLRCCSALRRTARTVDSTFTWLSSREAEPGR